jgi:hypothetical protein
MYQGKTKSPISERVRGSYYSHLGTHGIASEMLGGFTNLVLGNYVQTRHHNFEHQRYPDIPTLIVSSSTSHHTLISPSFGSFTPIRPILMRGTRRHERSDSSGSRESSASRGSNSSNGTISPDERRPSNSDIDSFQVWERSITDSSNNQLDHEVGPAMTQTREEPVKPRRTFIGKIKTGLSKVQSKLFKGRKQEDES